MKPDAVRRERRGPRGDLRIGVPPQERVERTCRSDDPSGGRIRRDGEGVEEAEIVREKWRRLLPDFRRSRFRKC